MVETVLGAILIVMVTTAAITSMKLFGLRL